MYNDFLKVLHAADKFTLGNVLKQIVQKYKFENADNVAVNLVAVNKRDDDVYQIFIRYIEGLNLLNINTLIGDLNLQNKNISTTHVANIFIDSSIKSDNTLFSKPGYSVIRVDVSPLNETVSDKDEFDFYSTILENIVQDLNIEVKDNNAKYIVEYVRPSDISESIYFDDKGRLSATDSDVYDIKGNLQLVAIVSRNYYVNKLNNSEDLLKAINTSRIIFDRSVVVKKYNELMDLYWRSPEFKDLVYQIAHRLNVLGKLQESLKLTVDDIDQIKNDTSLKSYIDAVINDFITSGQIVYTNSSEDATAQYIKRFFQLYGEVIAEKFKQAIQKRSNIFSNFISRIALKFEDYLSDVQRLEMEKLKQRLKEENRFSNEDLNILDSESNDLGEDAEQKKQQEEAKKQELPTITDPTGVSDESEVARLLTENDELILSEFGKASGAYTDAAKDEFDAYLMEKGYVSTEDNETGKISGLTEESSGRSLEQDEIKEVLNNFKNNYTTLSNSDILNIVDSDSSSASSSKVVFDNYMEERAHYSKIFNYFGSRAQDDNENLQELLQFIKDQVNELDEGNIDSNQVLNNIVQEVYSAPLDTDLSKSLLYACAYPKKDVRQWIKHLVAVISISIEILNIFINSDDNKKAMNSLRALFNENKSLENYFLKSKLQALDTSILDRKKFIENTNVDLISTIRQFLKWLNDYTDFFGFDVDEFTWEIVDDKLNKIFAINKDTKTELPETYVKRLVDVFNKEYSKKLTVDQLFSTNIGSSAQLSRPLIDEEFSDPQLSNARTEFINSINSIGLNNIEKKLNDIEEKINNIKWEEINVK